MLFRILETARQESERMSIVPDISPLDPSEVMCSRSRKARLLLGLIAPTDLVKKSSSGGKKSSLSKSSSPSDLLGKDEISLSDIACGSCYWSVHSVRMDGDVKWVLLGSNGSGISGC